MATPDDMKPALFDALQQVLSAITRGETSHATEIRVGEARVPNIHASALVTRYSGSQNIVLRLAVGDVAAESDRAVNQSVGNAAIMSALQTLFERAQVEQPIPEGLTQNASGTTYYGARLVISSLDEAGALQKAASALAGEHPHEGTPATDTSAKLAHAATGKRVLVSLDCGPLTRGRRRWKDGRDPRRAMRRLSSISFHCPRRTRGRGWQGR
jgi:hypothetical protein